MGGSYGDVCIALYHTEIRDLLKEKYDMPRAEKID